MAMSSREHVFQNEDGHFLVISEGRCRADGAIKRAFTFTDRLQQATTFDHKSMALANELIRSIPTVDGTAFSQCHHISGVCTVQVKRSVRIVHDNYQPLIARHRL